MDDLAKQANKPKLKLRALQCFVCGAAIGWLTGLSISPIVHVVLGSVLTIVATVVSALTMPKNKAESMVAITPAPLMWLVIGIALSSSVAIYVRANNLLGPDPRLLEKRWSLDSTNALELRRNLLSSLYGSPKVEPPESKSNSKKEKEGADTPIVNANPNRGGLFNTISAITTELREADTREARVLLQTLENGKYQTLVLSLTNSQVDQLRTFVCDLMDSSKRK